MYDNYNYPPGADNEYAPWNEPVIPEKEFEVTCSQSLSKTVPVITDNYIPGASGVDYESDDEGGYTAVGWHDPDDTSDTNWAEEYHANDYHTPLQLIQLFEQVLKNNLEHGIVFRSSEFTQDLINECKGWTEDETEYIEN